MSLPDTMLNCQLPPRVIESRATDVLCPTRERTMFWKKKTEPNPLGVPLSDLMALLEPTTIKASMKGSTLLARHEHYTIRIEVAPPEVADTEMGPIKAVVRMITDLPEPIETMFHAREAETAAALNSLAGLGGLYQEDRKVHIGSRLTIYEREAAWRT